MIKVKSMLHHAYHFSGIYVRIDKREIASVSLYMKQPGTHLRVDVSGGVKVGHVLRGRGVDDLDPEEDTGKDVHAESGDQEQPANLEQGGAEVNHCIVLNDSAAHAIKKPIIKDSIDPGAGKELTGQPTVTSRFYLH
jgi:hypothetical protein